MKPGSENSSIGGGSQSILSSLQGLEFIEAVQVVREHFIAKPCSYGVDSMIGAELRNWIFKELGLDISFQQLLGPSLTITKFAEDICAKAWEYKGDIVGQHCGSVHKGNCKRKEANPSVPNSR
ncbi:Acyl transferase/acyl hydrolase/lysophospholipase [Penicillium hordei]|uniref:Acyl transferase/acyl hydrolase/lysophospholipase n=1 Tax=Penicillium hordei TaxID=40994 RepID=A0AAD6H992_9EURO|nr:Acyl transferase/acyl hydrolase/lysophospholipase [Penicillium hordei]KAJ5617564.1 Acyl transferase/acyl hydrolase/lysophospholipase [Penicillium hordei]